MDFVALPLCGQRYTEKVTKRMAGRLMLAVVMVARGGGDSNGVDMVVEVLVVLKEVVMVEMAVEAMVMWLR